LAFRDVAFFDFIAEIGSALPILEFAGPSLSQAESGGRLCRPTGEHGIVEAR
jgi:hypothetical protein